MSHLRLIALLGLSHPFIFLENPEFDAMSFINDLFPFMDPGREQVRAVVLTILFVFAINPAFADIFVPFAITELAHMDLHVASGLAFVLYSLAGIHSVQHIIVALLIKHDWCAIATGVLEEVDGRQWESLVSSVLGLLILMGKSVMNARQGVLASARHISETDSPFSTFIQKPLCLSRDELTSLIPGVLRGPLKAVRFDVGVLEELTAEVLCSLEIATDSPFCPRDFDPVAFAQLPDELKSVLLSEFLPRRHVIMSHEIFQYLSTQPPWVSEWIITRPSSVFHSSYYDILSDVIEHLNAQGSPNPEDSIPAFVDSSDLPKAVLALTEPSCYSPSFAGIAVAFLELLSSESEWANQTLIAISETLDELQSSSEVVAYLEFISPFAGKLSTDRLFRLAYNSNFWS
jgi:hypothetical protein